MFVNVALISLVPAVPLAFCDETSNPSVLSSTISYSLPIGIWNETLSLFAGVIETFAIPSVNVTSPNVPFTFSFLSFIVKLYALSASPVSSFASFFVSFTFVSFLSFTTTAEDAEVLDIVPVSPVLFEALNV